MAQAPPVVLQVMKLKPLILVPAAVCALVLAGCSSNDSSDNAATSADAGSDQSTAASTSTCPTEVPAATTQPDWVFQGKTGSIEVVAPTADKAPLITVNGTFAVDETTVKTLKPGTGADVTAASTVTFCYHGVTGRDGSTFDDSYSRGEPIQYPATQLVPGFTKALVGQKVGATVGVAVAPADGYPNGTPDGGIKPGDSIVFALSILDAS